MIEVPYYTPGVGYDEAARRAGVKRAIYYGSSGFIDPRTWTLDPALFYVHHRRSSPHLMRRTIAKRAFAGSMRMAFVTSAYVGGVAYMGADPFNVTPGYGHTPVEGGMSVDGESYSHLEYLRRGLDTRKYHM